MKDIIDRLTREPVIVINIIKAALVLLTVFGIMLQPDQKDAIMQLVIALIAIFGGGAAVERQMVTPLTHPRLPEDTIVHVTDENGNTIKEKEL
jgi:cell division protein FtsW (lipid II flippase)